MNLTDSDLRRFWSKVALPDQSGCMLWLAGCCKDGYGQFAIGRSKVRAPRLSLWLAAGPPLPDQEHAAHSCRHRHCVAPAHLRWATHIENEADKIADGTVARGDLSNWSKLTSGQVLEIRALYATGAWTYPQLGTRFGVAQQTIGKIVNRDRWAHLEDAS